MASDTHPLVSSRPKPQKKWVGILVISLLIAAAIVAAGLFIHNSVQGHTISGKVINYLTHEPIVNATISLMNDQVNYKTTSLSFGKWSIKSLNAGTYTLSVSAIDFIDHVEEISIPHEQEVSISLKSSLHHIFGHITSGNSPVFEATVSLVDSHGESRFADLSLINGKFELTYVPTGDYTLKVSCDGFVPFEKNIHLTDTLTNLHLEVDPKFNKVIGSFTPAMYDTKVTINHSRGSLTTMTSVEGKFAFDEIPSGVTTLKASYDGYYITHDGEFVKSEYVYAGMLTKREEGKVQVLGKVLSKGTDLPLSKANISFNNTIHIKTDKFDGIFVTIIEPGTYDVKIEATGYHDKVLEKVVIEEDRDFGDIVLKNRF
ncbi:hypothetical protein GEMRC1_003812 [Eukaryota sp. GEM-RC1]